MKRRGQIELDSTSGEVRVRFEYDSALVEVLRSIPRRRFSREDKAWYVPAESVGMLLRAVSPVDFSIAPEVVALAEKVHARALRAAELKAQVRQEEGASEDPRDGRTLTPAELNTQVRTLLRRTYPESVWVVGELTGWKDAHGGRAAFFDLVEKSPKSAIQRARVKAVIFPEELRLIQQKVARMREAVALEDGVQVRLRGRVELHEGSGSFQLRVEDIDPYHTLSASLQQRELVLEAVEELGLRELNLGLPMPALPLRVGLITSQGSDAAHDFLDELRRSGYGFEVHLYDARMQGKALEKTVVAGFERFARVGGVDVVVLARGGGARSDLAHFNTLPIALAVCRHPVPVVCGVGHHLDQCVVDDLARSLKTPTAAAQFLVGLVREAVAELDEAGARLREGLGRSADARRSQLAREGQRLGQLTHHKLGAAQRALVQVGAQLGHGAAAQLKGSARALHELEGRLPASVELRLSRERRHVEAVRGGLDFARLSRKLARRRAELDEARERLSKGLRAVKARARELDAQGQRLARVVRGLQAKRAELDEAQRRVRRAALALTQRQGEALARLELRREAADPARVLARGFALVRDAQGKTVRRASEVLGEARLVVALAQGVLGVRVDGDGGG